MAKVTDIQDKNGVSKEIQDKDLANRTSQSTVASTDYILLEDTDGAYHKIAKASFTEAVRGALGSVINSVAKGTDIAKVPVLDSNNDLGMGTLANLASVLGVLPKVGYSESAWDNYTDYFVMPYVGMDGPVLLINFPFTWNNKQACVELSIDRTRIAIRTYWTNEWSTQKSVVFQ